MGGEGRSLRGHEECWDGKSDCRELLIYSGHSVWSGGTLDNVGPGTNGVKKQMGQAIAPHCARVESPQRGLLGSAQGHDHPLTLR